MGRGQELLDAAREGEMRTVEKILGQITKRSGPFPSLRRTAGVNVQDENGYTPLHHACLNGHKDIIQQLLAADASPHVVDKKGVTPFHLAAFNGDPEVVRMLLTHNNPPNIDQLTSDHESALLIAAQFGFVNIVAQLVAKGADVTVKNIKGDSALDLAVQYDRLATVQHLLHFRPQLLDEYRLPASRGKIFESTPLHRASRTGRKDVVKALIDAGMDPNIRTKEGTPLHEATRFGQDSIVRVLLKRGADIKVQDSNRKTVYDLLTEYPESATRKIKKALAEHAHVITPVTAEYENYVLQYDSDEDSPCPPFPVEDCSNMLRMSDKLPIIPPALSLSTNNCSSTNCNNKKSVTNSPSHTTNLLPPGSISPNFKSQGSTERSLSFSYKSQNNKGISVYKNQCGVISANQNANKKNISYENQNKDIEHMDIYENMQTINKEDSCDDFTSSLKKKPKPLPKPPVILNDFNKSSITDICDSPAIECDLPVEHMDDVSYANQNLYENITRNMPDDEKVMSNIYCDTDEINTPSGLPMEHFVTRCYTVSHSNSHNLKIKSNDNLDNMQKYKSLKNLSPKRMSNPDSITVYSKMHSVHNRDDVSSIHGSVDCQYVSDLNPKIIKGNAYPFIKMKEKRKVISELQKINTKLISNDDQNGNVASKDIYEIMQTKDKEELCDDSNGISMDNYTISPIDTDSIKKKPKLLPKPSLIFNNLNKLANTDACDPAVVKYDLPVEYSDGVLYANQYVNEGNNYDASTSNQNIAQNMPDDEKVKSNVICDSGEIYLPSYISMGQCATRCYTVSDFNSYNLRVDKFDGDLKNIEKYEDYICLKNLSHKRMSDPDRVSACLKKNSVHNRGDVSCRYGSLDYLYVYDLNPLTIRGNAYPFIKRKVKATPMPCCCRDSDVNNILKSNSKKLYASQLVYYSCENVYEYMSRSDVYTSLSDVDKKDVKSNDIDRNELSHSVEEIVFKLVVEGESNDTDTYETKFATMDSKTSTLLKKKFQQFKQLIVEWKPTETPKHTNQNDSITTPSSSYVSKYNTPSFVKKLASKCLGLKAKFNSAPNISNSLTAEVDVKSKQIENKNNTSTLLIGNSKFFKMLSKKEESGEVVCNDEFDTISLDRLGTLNRDSVVNRSNRSCPGFKTSLPNISENNELSDSQESISESVVITEIESDKNNKVTTLTEAINYDANFNIFEPRTQEAVDRKSIKSNTSVESRNLVNECYESYEFSKRIVENNSIPTPPLRSTYVKVMNNNDSNIYENVIMEIKTIPKPAMRTHIPIKPPEEVRNNTLYENVKMIQEQMIPEPLKRTIVLPKSNFENIDSSSFDSRSSTLSFDSMVDESNLEDILLSKKSKSFRHRKISTDISTTCKSEICRTQSNASDSSNITELSAIENVDCSQDVDDKALYLSMTGTMPNKKHDLDIKKVLFRHKTFTNIDVDRNSVRVKDLPQWNTPLKETLSNYHIRGTGHCIYNAPTIEEFIYIFNRDTLHSDVPPFTKVPTAKRDSYYETAICFCRPKPSKCHTSAEDLLEQLTQEVDSKATIDIEALRNRIEILSSSFQCYCDSGSCIFHSIRRKSPIDLVVKFSVLKKSISTPDITLNSSSLIKKNSLPKNKSLPKTLEDPYAIVTLENIISRKSNDNEITPDSPVYITMSQHSTVSSTASAGLYSLKDISEVVSLNNSSTSTATLSRASDVHLPIRKSSSSEHSGHWSLQSCNSNITIKSDASFKTCLEESSNDSDSTLHSDAEISDAETVKSDVSTAKRPWVHSDSFRFGTKTKSEIDVIVEETQSEDKYDTLSSKFESGISLEGSESSSSECEDDSGVPRTATDVSLECASLERGGGLGGVRSGSARRRWDEADGTSEGDALSVSSAASSCAPLHLHHHGCSKVSPTPPKKPPRRNLSVSPTHANSPSSGYSYELRPHARSQDDLDDIQGAKHYLKHGRSVDQYVDGKLSYSEYEETHNSRVIPIPNPRPSLKQRSQPVAITAVYENVAIKEQNPRRKLKRNNFVPSDNYEPKMNDSRVRKYSNQENTSLESLLDDQSLNSPSDCERYYEGHRAHLPLSPTHYEQPPTPDHPPPSARQAENCIHERIRPLSQLIMEVVEEIRIRKMSQSDISTS